ncbi:MAG: S-layer homology domain-containing protein [Syntrophomonas sp.]|nr:S-layer homology domain-containing protein [Syntrophomonas sp.]
MMKRLIKLTVLIFLLSLPVPLALGQQEVPSLPALCYGEISIQGAPAPAEITVEAIVDGIVCGKITSSEEGYYGGPGIKSKLAVSGNQLDGSRIDFYITGRYNNQEYKRVKAGEALYWGSGEVKQINLEVPVDPPIPYTPGGGNGGGPGTTAPPSTDTEKNVATLSEQLISYQTRVMENGQIIEHIVISNTASTEINNAKAKGNNTIAINLSSKSESDIKVITIPAEVINSAQNMNIQINLAGMSIEIPAAILNLLAKNTQELKISLQPGDAQETKNEIKAFPQTQGATVLGNPVEIMADLHGTTSVTLPLGGINIPKDPAERHIFLSNLAIFAIHSDGEKELIKGELIFDKDGVPLTIRFSTSKFSTFAIIKLSEKQETICNDISGNWAESSIRILLAAGAISGYPDKSFRPNQNITRAEFTTVLVKAFRLTPTNGNEFTDCKSHWAQHYISTAATHGIVQGYSKNVFAPDQPITREQMAVMMVKVCGLKKTDWVKQFSDEEQVSDWAREAIDIAAGNQLINGYPDGSFGPLKNATRAEVATIIVTALNKTK